MELITIASQVSEEYKQGLNYKKSMGFIKSWEEYEKFRAGDQWPAPTEKTKNLPRPVFNIIRYIENHKVSSVMNNQIKMVYSPTEYDEQGINQEKSEQFNKFAEDRWEFLKQDKLNEEVLDSACNVGTGLVHYYWDNSIKGGMSYSYIGEMQGEVIDPMNFFPGNPQQLDIQKQPYIIITYRDLVKNIRQEAVQGGLSKEEASLINADKDTEDQGYSMAKTEINGVDKATVLVKYWKEQGQVMFTKVCGSSVVKKPTQTGLTRYPLAIMQWEKRKKSIFGIGDTEGLIPNQKLINFLIAMQSLSVQLTGFPKLEINPQFVKQQITNAPGEIIYNNDPSGQSHVNYISPGNFSNQAQQIVETIINHTKTLAGATETSTGELQKSSQMNASAIMLLQKASGIPIEGIRRRFYNFVEDIGLIWEEFFKVKYNTTRSFETKDDEGNQTTATFNGQEFEDLELKLKIDVGASSEYSETLSQTSLDKFLESGYIDLKTYLDLAPQNVVPFKNKLLKILEQREKEQQEMMFQDTLSQMTPEEQQMFKNASPEQQEAIKQQMLQGMQQQPQGGMQ